MKIRPLFAAPLALLALLLATPSAEAAVKTREVSYKGDGLTMKGFLAWDDAVKGKRPGVLVVHEWWGHNDYARKRARMLAEMGYTALALDMYGDGKTAAHPEDAGKFVAEVLARSGGAKARFDAALALLRAEKTVDPKRVAAIGYCFGGAVVLEMARLGTDLSAVVSFHGSLAAQAPAAKGKVKAKILVFNGNDDPFVSAEEIAAFRKEMDDAGADYRFVGLAGAKHSFSNPDADEYAKKFNLPLAYSATADKESWGGMREFFATVFGNAGR